MKAVTARGVLLEGVGSSSTQGDAGVPALLARMGAEVQQGAGDTLVRGPAAGAAPGPQAAPAADPLDEMRRQMDEMRSQLDKLSKGG
jgi:hypothetical protein